MPMARRKHRGLWNKTLRHSWSSWSWMTDLFSFSTSNAHVQCLQAACTITFPCTSYQTCVIISIHLYCYWIHESHMKGKFGRRITLMSPRRGPWTGWWAGRRPHGPLASSTLWKHRRKQTLIGLNLHSRSLYSVCARSSYIIWPQLVCWIQTCTEIRLVIMKNSWL